MQWVPCGRAGDADGMNPLRAVHSVLSQDGGKEDRGCSICPHPRADALGFLGQQGAHARPWEPRPDRLTVLCL